jgi:hypothetical protein
MEVRMIDDPRFLQHIELLKKVLPDMERLAASDNAALSERARSLIVYIRQMIEDAEKAT